MKDSIYLATPTIHGDCCMAYCQSLLRTYENCRVNEIDLYTDYLAGSPYVCLARNILAARFLASKCEALLFVDADMGFDYEAAVKLYRLNLSFVGGVYPRKQDKEDYPVRLLNNYDGECQEAVYLPTGFMMVRREVFAAIKAKCQTFPDQGSGKPIHAYFQTTYHEQGMVGEDVSFCNRWRSTGGKIWLYPNINFEHHGNKAWRGNFEKMMDRELEKAA